jgi:N6-adenosine-specific RNA methylase IME4
MCYSIIYADPPWKTSSFKETKEGLLSRPLPYPQLSNDEIKELPVKDMVAENAILFMWVIDSRIPIMPAIMKAWGFEFVSVGFVWVKKAKTTNGVNATWSSYTRKACEFCYIGKRGNYMVRKKNVDQLIIDPKREHSRKPDIVRDRIVEMVGDVPRLELFARETVPGWKQWGNEITKFNLAI